MVQGSRVAWAKEEFSSLDLGHAARTACAMDVLANMGRATGTKVTDFTESGAERQQAYGLVENAKTEPGRLTAAAAQAALQRLTDDDEFGIVPADGSSLKLSDEQGTKGFGRVGSHDSTRGLLVQTAMALSSTGVPLGILAQTLWARSLSKAPKGSAARKRKPEDKESRYWLDVVKTAEAAAVEAGMDGRLWFQLDRGYDSSVMLDWMSESRNRVTIRGEYNRALWVDDAHDDEASSQHRYVKDVLDAVPVLSVMSLNVEGSAARAARVARLQVQVAEVEVRLRDPSRRKTVRGADGKRRKAYVTWPRTLTAVRVCEVETTPTGESPLQWMLWVNFTVDSTQLAETVVRMYSYRWRVEEFHRLWKSGAMKVEQTQARSGDNVERIVRMSALVACRLLRLTRLARETPDAPASDELSDSELAVLTHMDPRSPKQAPRPQRLGTLAWAIAVIADFGGYTGKSSGRAPGPLVLARGYRRMCDRAAGFEAAWRIRDQW